MKQFKKSSKWLIVSLLALMMTSCSTEKSSNRYQLFMHAADGREILVANLPEDISKPFTIKKEVENVKIDFNLTPKTNYTSFRATATSEKLDFSFYLSLHINYTNEVPFNFNGSVDSTEIYRQSPHDVNAWITEKLAKQSVPMVALKSDSGFTVALTGSPYLYDNFTSQSFDLENKVLQLSSGDNGRAPGIRPDTAKQLGIEYNTDKTQVMAPGKIMLYYFIATTKKPHVFEGVLFTTKAININGLRKDVNEKAADYFSNGKYNDYFGSLAFTTAYMNLRVNETKKSKYWIVPSVEYGNTQYGRDAFWISSMLPPELDAECLQNELSVVNQYAEYPLVTIIWAYRSFKEKKIVDKKMLQAYMDAIELRAKENKFYSFLESDGRLDFQYWGDVIAFEKTDVVTYNQGLFALALAMANEIGLTIRSNPEEALKHYQNSYDKKLGFYPISQKKSILGPDPLVPDLLSQLYLGKKMLDSKTVQSHFNRMVNYSKTNFGFKVVATPDGKYLPAAMYDVADYISQVNREKMPDGRYFKGGSYFLYDNLFLIDAYLHGIKEAEDELIWRTSLDFKIGSTAYECLNTITGEPWKPNMGWNVAIYSIWRKLVEEGKASDRLFKNIDSLVNKKRTN